MNGIYLLLGSNMGNRLEYLKEAEKLLIGEGIQVIDESSIYETEPWGKQNQDWFLNVILQVETSKEPDKLLETILDIERSLGRVFSEERRLRERSLCRGICGEMCLWEDSGVGSLGRGEE